MRYNLYFIIILFISFPVRLTSQSADDKGIILPIPTIGWDSLGKSIRCPDLMTRAGIQGRILVVLYIDSLGKTEDVSVGDFINIETFDSARSELMRDYIRKYFSVITWNPAIKNGKKVDYRISIPIYFLFKEEGQVDPILVRRTKPHINY